MGDLGNKADQAQGKIKEGAGKATGDRELEGEGKGDQMSAKAQGAVHDAKKKAGDAAEKMKGMFGSRK
ncbi:CsbD family protein [Actinomadura rayongensis]|uniref:CsbD family protein n=1 Tax=Actinomadura rayongensis TaxID=1429076 RepID=A0A6I4W6W2_9ACTN|nr:CsbD family protein [Actinomadura rayongensis]MXQ62874.1 CsbD family protein [Actinomadura rayongensis]